MKIGILTLHSQLNYGGVLQCFALQEVLKSLGHDVLVIDRSVYSDNGVFQGILNSKSLSAWINFIGRGILGFGDFSDLKRRRKTKRFIDQELNLTPYSFYLWKDAPKPLGVDLLVVGSDQVWNPTDPNILSIHMLEGAPPVKAISYAASFGIKQIPPDLKTKYQDGLSRFNKISVREQEGLNLVKELGRNATKVLDPVLLSNISTWDKIAPVNYSRPKVLFCYFLSLKIEDHIIELLNFAKQQNAIVKVFGMEGCIELPPSMMKAIKVPLDAFRQKLSRVRMQRDAAPNDFVAAIRSSTWVLTDSFHALAFSILFNKNVRVIRPTDSFRKGMFARIEETVTNYATQSVISDSCSDALSSFGNNVEIKFNSEQLIADRETSLSWLRQAINDSHA